MEGTLLLHVNYGTYSSSHYHKAYLQLTFSFSQHFSGKAMSNGKYKSILHRAVMNKAINLSI